MLPAIDRRRSNVPVLSRLLVKEPIAVNERTRRNLMEPKIEPGVLGNPDDDLALSQRFEVQVFHRLRRSDNGITDVIEIEVVNKDGVRYPRSIRVTFDHGAILYASDALQLAICAIDDGHCHF
jgi:hypothetical protein